MHIRTASACTSTTPRETIGSSSSTSLRIPLSVTITSCQIDNAPARNRLANASSGGSQSKLIASHRTSPHTQYHSASVEKTSLSLVCCAAPKGTEYALLANKSAGCKPEQRSCKRYFLSDFGSSLLELHHPSAARRFSEDRTDFSRAVFFCV